jgi:integrase/recombinase XerD
MNELIAKYLEDLNKRNLSINTKDSYARDLNKFCQFLMTKGINIEEVDEIAIMAFIQHIKNLGMANSSILRYSVSIKGFYRYLLKNDIIIRDPTIRYDNIKAKKKNIPKILTVEEISRLLDAPDTTLNKGKRDKAMLEVMYAAGLKVSELINLRMDDINLKLAYLICRDNRKKERIIPLGSYAIKCLNEYFSIRNEINIYNLDNIFLNLRGTEMTRQGFWKILKSYVKPANIDKVIYPNIIRHSFAVHLLENGADLKSVQELLGHKDISITQIYYNISRKNKIAEVYKRSHPRA